MLTYIAKFLEDKAVTLERWAKESREGGWSTHQVEANPKMAEECRHEASRIRGIIAAFTSLSARL